MLHKNDKLNRFRSMCSVWAHGFGRVTPGDSIINPSLWLEGANFCLMTSKLTPSTEEFYDHTPPTVFTSFSYIWTSRPRAFMTLTPIWCASESQTAPRSELMREWSPGSLHPACMSTNWIVAISRFRRFRCLSINVGARYYARPANMFTPMVGLMGY